MALALGAAWLSSCDSESNQASNAQSAKDVQVTSSLAGKSALPRHIRWIATLSEPTSQIDRVEFLIDGKTRWIDREAPFTYGGDGGYLVTTWIKPGRRRFATRVVDTQGVKITQTVVARVRPSTQPGMPGIYSRRRETAAEPCCRTGDRTLLLPPNLLLIARYGEDKQWHGHAYEYVMASKTLRLYAPVQMNPAGVGRNILGYHIDGYDCQPGGPFASYAWSASGGQLRLEAESDPCRTRRAILEHLWFLVD
jgi:hypothetical protein